MSDFSEEYKKYWTIAWAFHKKYYGTRTDDNKTWQEIIENVDKISEEHDKNNFLGTLLLDVVNELDRTARAEKKAEKERKRQATLAKKRAKEQADTPIS